jgi:hypothetical protein
VSEYEDETAEDFPPSVKLVVKTLQHEAPLTQKQLCQSTLLSPRTARYAINRLEDAGAIDSKPNPDDARQQVYDLPSSIQPSRTRPDTETSGDVPKESNSDILTESPQSESTSDQDLMSKIESEFKELE